MKNRSVSHLSDQTLAHEFTSRLDHVRVATVDVLPYLAEFDARKLYAPEGYPSMHAYLVGEKNLPEDSAYKQIRAARAARKFPVLFDALEDGRLNLSAIVLLAPHLKPENVDDLVAAAAFRSMAEIRGMLAARFPRSESLGLVEALPTRPGHAAASDKALSKSLAPEPVELCVSELGPRSRVDPVAAGRFQLKATISQSAQDTLEYVRYLLGPEVRDLGQVLELAFEALKEKLEKQKFGAHTRRRRGGRDSANPRHIPMHVRHAVWKRDGGKCTFASESGHRCEARRNLEFDHIVEVARGGETTVSNLRLRCRTHNQYAAECAFGPEFMQQKREAARETRARAAETKRQEAERRKAAAAEARAAENARREEEEARRKEAEARARAAAEEVITPLRLLGFSAKEAQWAAKECEAAAEAPLDQRVRLALGYLRPRVIPPAAPGAFA